MILKVHKPDSKQKALFMSEAVCLQHSRNVKAIFEKVVGGSVIVCVGCVCVCGGGHSLDFSN